MSILLFGRWNSELFACHKSNENEDNNTGEECNKHPKRINLGKILNGKSIKDICLGVYHMIILTDQNEIYIAGTSLPYEDKCLQIVENTDVYFPVYKVVTYQILSQLTSKPIFQLAESQVPLIACGPEFGVFTHSFKEGPKHRHFLSLFGWDSKKVFDSQRITTRNSLMDILQGLLLEKTIVEEIPSNDCEPITHLVCGGDFWLTVIGGRKLFGKGYNAYGVLGLGHKRDIKKVTSLPVQDMLMNSENDSIEKISCGLHHAIFSLNTSEGVQIFTSGDNRFGQTGQSITTKFQTNFSKSNSLTNIIQKNGFRDTSCEYQSSWILTSNNRVFACGLLSGETSNIATNPSSLQVQKVFEPTEFIIPYTSSLFSNCISPKNPIHLGCGGFHSILGNHRSDSLVGIGANICSQIVNPIIEEGIVGHSSNKVIEKSIQYIDEFTSVHFHSDEKMSQIQRILCSRDCSMVLITELSTIEGLKKQLECPQLFDVVITTCS